MILFAGALILAWLMVLAATAMHVSGMRWRLSWGAVCGLVFCLLPLLLFLLRPDEEMEAGEDPGSYLHSAISLAREQRFWFLDTGLALVPAEERPLFRYGHAGFLATKDAVLWSPDMQSIEVGPHFLPAYSVLLSVPVSLGFPYGAFWISPLLALLGAVLLGLLARGLTNSTWVGWLAGGAYLLNPVAAWNARALRAEWPAAVLVLGGLVLLHACWTTRRPLKGWVGWLAGFSLAGAMLFHITALYVLLPVMVVVLWDRIRQPPPFWTGVAMGWGLLLLQLVYVCDPYWILPQFSTWQRRLALLAGVSLLIGLPLVAGRLWLWWTSRTQLSKSGLAKGFGFLLMIGFLLVVLLAWRYRRADGAIFFLPAHYISLTDVKGVARLFSRFWFAVTLAGIPVLALRGGQGGNVGRRICCILFPAALVVGWMNHYMFETRRLLLAWMPLAILSSVLFAWWVGRTVGWLLERYGHAPRRLMIECSVMLAVVGLCLAAGLRGRTQLYYTWNNRGMYRLYQDISKIVRREGDVLLASYTQTAVPVERLSGLPLLPFAWDYRSEEQFRRAELVFERLVQENPDTRFLFLTPFQGVALPGLALERVADWNLKTERLARARHAVPDRKVNMTRTLSLYRLHSTSLNSTTFPYSRIMDGERFGIKGCANLMRKRMMDLKGVKVASDGLVLDAILPDEAGPECRLLLFLATPNGDFGRVEWELRRSSGTVAIYGKKISDKWSTISIAGSDLLDATLIPKAQADIYVTDAYLLSAEEPPLRLNKHETESFKMGRVDSQWLRANSSLALPVDNDQRFLYLHATPGRDIDGMAQVTVTPVADAAPAVSVSVANAWQWIVLPLPGTGDGRFTWYDVHVDPPWNPGIRDFPDDLGLRLSTVIVE